MRIVGLDVSRSVAEIAYLEDGVLCAGGRAGLRRDELERFAAKLHKSDHVLLEATGNTAAIVNVLRPHVARVAIANPLQVRLIAEARVKTDKIDAAVLAQLYASHFLPEVWMPDESTLALRRQVSRRAQLVRQRTRLKNEVHAVLAAHLIERCPATDLFGKKGRMWLGAQPLPMDERLGVEQRLRELDRLGEDLHEVDQALAQVSIGDERLRRLLTITGVNTTVAIGLLSAIGTVERFSNPEKIAIVATARKLAVIVWHVLTRNEPFAWDRPALTAHKLRALELQSGMPTQHGSRKGSAAAYSLKSVRDQERAVAEQAERTYQRLFSRWKQARPKGRETTLLWPETRGS